MFPGTISKLSEKTIPTVSIIDADVDVIYLSGNGTITTINPKAGGFSQFLVLVANNSANIVISAAGNIGLNGSVTTPLSNNRANAFYFSKIHNKWVQEFY